MVDNKNVDNKSVHNKNLDNMEAELIDQFMNDVSASLELQLQEKSIEKKDIIMKKNKKKKHKILWILSFILIMTFGIVFFVKSNFGKKQVLKIASNIIYDELNFDDESIKVNGTNEPGNNDLPLDGDKDTYNIALIGSQEGNTDVMMIATLNMKDKTLTLTSLLRDTYVEMPDYPNAKLNAAYQRGGINLFYKTIEQNFEAHLDGYVLVDYSTFEYIIDRIDGVEVTLTKKEADYLNTTNYISNPKLRNVVEGTQTLKGNQALGYCRIRKVPTVDNEYYDFGRTARQRTVIKAVYNQLKSKNIFELISIMNDILKNTNIKTDIDKEKFQEYLSVLVDMKVDQINTYRIPSEGTYTNEERKIGKRNSAVVIVSDWDSTREELNNILNGKIEWK